jgi:ABC-2 type transport system ATP-binding protein
MIKIESLNKFYKESHVLKDISFEVQKGELFSYLGPNGAGKSTTIRILTGLTRLSSGSISINGFNILKRPIDAKRQCGLVPQSVNLDSELTVAENLDIHGRLFNMTKKKRGERADLLLDYIDLSDRRNTLVKQLSGGMKRRVMIARALMHSPRVLFLDEPTVGLDANIRRKIWSLIKKIKNSGTTIFLTTHYIEEAEFLAERVAFIDKGKIVEINTPLNYMDELGKWAIDIMNGDNMETVYFGTREDAKNYTDKQKESYSLRRVNLEDSFLKKTGRKRI